MSFILLVCGLQLSHNKQIRTKLSFYRNVGCHASFSPLLSALCSSEIKKETNRKCISLNSKNCPLYITLEERVKIFIALLHPHLIDTLIKGINVLVHCSDGWDRTSQVVSISQICIDPYFRTIEGFGVLIEKEWVFAGHQFGLGPGTPCL